MPREARHRPSSVLTLAAGVAAVMILGPRPAAAQGGGPQRATEPRPPAFSELIEVRIINLEAVVVDRQGQRVRDLGPGDFRLRVDGREVPIEYFTEITEGHARPAGEPAGAPSQAPGTAALAPPPGIDPGRPVGTSFLLFIDDFLTVRPSDRNQVLEALVDDLGRLGPDDRMAIVAFDGRKIDMLANWTGSRRELARALTVARGRPLRGLAVRAQARDLGNQAGTGTVTERDLAMADFDGAIGGAGPGGLTDENAVPLDFCSRIERFESQLHKAVLGATATLRGFAQPPGRRVMLLLSGGWPSSVRDYLMGGGLGPDGRPLVMAAAGRCHQEGPGLFRPLYETANLLGYTLYPVQLPRSATPAVSAGGASFAGDDTGGTARFELHSTLLRLAEETGGQAMTEGARLTALERVVDDIRSYYWIGFTPSWKGDDREHRVELEVLRPGLNVRTRKGFQDLSRSTEVSFMVESALLFGDPPAALPLRLQLGPAGKGKRPLVPLQVVIPMDTVTMVPHGNHFVAHLELRVAVLDERGNQNEISVIPVVLEGPRPPPGSHATYETAIRLRREAHDVVISLYDPLSGTLHVTKTRFVP
jgi:VWFA-related protein